MTDGTNKKSPGGSQVEQRPPAPTVRRHRPDYAGDAVESMTNRAKENFDDGVVMPVPVKSTEWKCQVKMFGVLTDGDDPYFEVKHYFQGVFSFSVSIRMGTFPNNQLDEDWPTNWHIDTLFGPMRRTKYPVRIEPDKGNSLYLKEEKRKKRLKKLLRDMYFRRYGHF